MSHSLGAREAAVAGADHDVDQPVAGLIERHFPAQDAGNVQVNVLDHRARRLGIGGELDNWFDRIADDVALAGRKQVHNESGRGLQSDALRSG